MARMIVVDLIVIIALRFSSSVFWLLINCLLYERHLPSLGSLTTPPDFTVNPLVLGAFSFWRRVFADLNLGTDRSRDHPQTWLRWKKSLSIWQTANRFLFLICIPLELTV